ncbi:hypothetical protein AB6A40_006309 [Gnathostoma spinigerum]|uniref:Serrate RNA effector molecule homolog n=1 Tax=Gnathostoma spinigerum TaxID=75299 RepID=A0ABD6EJ74_9BILA
MADSDDEYHRRGGREKFVRERNDYTDRSRLRDYDGDRRGYQRSDYSNGSSMKRPVTNRRDDFTSGGTKRSRIDSASDSYDPVIKPETDNAPPSPVMMTFKRFLSTQDDAITDEEAISKYSEYKMEFKRQELQKFFSTHKDEEWFRLKYHPDDSARRKNEQKENIRKRLEIFESMCNDGTIDKLRIDFDCAPEIIRAMDTLVVRLEGGTDDDVAALSQEAIEDESVTELKNKNYSTKMKLSATNDESKPKDNGGEETGNDDGAISDSDGEKREEREISKPEGTDGEGRQRKKTQLHKTSSIFLRNVSPNITLEEIETACKRFPGFLRVGLADPVPDRKWYRRGWVTFRRDVNIKEICWNLNNVRIGDCDLGAIVNRDLTRRVRVVNGITGHKTVAQNDLRQAAKLTAMYDKKAGLYQSETTEGAKQTFEMDMIVKSRNPVLENLTDFLIEEANAEEEELLGISSGTTNDEDQKVPFTRDEALVAKLDKIIVYLRIVHSIDFYNHGEYPNEDVMPNRCGMMHVRGDAPSSSQFSAGENGETLIPQKFISDFISGFNSRLEANLMSDVVLTETDLQNLGQKDADKEVEAFIQANCVELAKDKWLCPLSGKKFKGPEFIRKHLMSKHQEKLDQVRLEVIFLNNYLADPKRPQNPEVKPAVTPSPNPPPPRDERREREDDRNYGGRTGGSSYNDRNRGYGGSRYGASSYGSGRSYDRGGSRGYWDGSARRDPREPVTYKDLDAPEDIF